MIDALYQHYLHNPKISTDTRKIEPGSLFFALKGPNFNANTLASEAIEKGASLAVIDEGEYQQDDRFFLVSDVLQTLQQLATLHRSKLEIPVIGLTGSNGKTTTKELINASLSPKYNVLATAGNLNNHIGVPLTLLSITSSHEIAIIEMGANHIGEIESLCAIAKPTHGLITNIGKAHLEGFGGFDGVIRAKSELYHHLIQTNGVVWINSGNEILSNMAKRFKAPLFYPGDNDYYHAEFIDASPFVKLKTENNEEVTTQLIGGYNFENIAAALCIAKYFGVLATDSNEAIKNYRPSNNRSQVVKRVSNTIILDAYNANPSSMQSALDNLDMMEAMNKMVILGDMKELGKSSEAEHRLLGQKASKLQLKNIFLVGEEIAPALDHLSSALHFTHRDELINYLKNNMPENATILVKGSRSMGLEKVVDFL